MEESDSWESRDGLRGKRRRYGLEKNILKQLPYIRKEITDIEKEISSIQKKIIRLKQDEVCDTVTGSREDLTIGPIMIRGHPKKEYGKRMTELQKKKTLMEKKRTELLRMEREAEEYIQSISDMGLHQILRYRYIYNLSWQQVANRMGWKYTAESCRKRAERFFMSD